MPSWQNARRLVREHENEAIQSTSHFLGAIGLEYLKDRLDSDVSSEFGNMRVLMDVWLMLFGGDHVRLIEFYEKTYDDREPTRHESLIDLFLVSFAASVLAGIVVKEYEVRRGQTIRTVRALVRKCRLALAYLLDIYALKDLRERGVVSPEEYQVLSRRLKKSLRGKKLTSRDVTKRVVPFYTQLHVSSSADVLRVLEETIGKTVGHPDKPNEPDISMTPSDVRVTIDGLPASSGIAAGTLKVVREPEDAEKLKTGDVAAFFCPVSPDMIPILRRISGLISYYGMTSHLSITARALGIPAVVGIKDTTEILDGAHVIVDGKSGKVHILRE
jgi:phosphohistidine swiveling domain-containing protein